MKLWLLHTVALASDEVGSGPIEINPVTTPATTTSTIQIETTPASLPDDFLDSQDKKAIEERPSNDFYDNGLAQIRSDWNKILAAADGGEAKEDRLNSKLDKIIDNLTEKDADYSGNDKLEYPYLDGTYPSATKNDIDPSRPCDAIDALANDIKQWTANFIEGAARPCGPKLAKSSCYSPPFGALRGHEINKKWHKRTLQFVRQTNQRVDKLVTKFKNAQQCKYCVRVTSSADQDLCKDAGNWLGGEIKLLINGELKDTLRRGFTEFEYCPSWDEIDVENDRIQLQSTNTDGVCITSLSLNGNQMLVGNLNDRPSFWIDGDQHNCPSDDADLYTPQITFKNGEVLSSQCKEEVCIKVTSNMDNSLCSGGGNKAKNWLGGDIYLNHNGQTIAKTFYGFLNFEHCVGASKDDEFQLQASNDDGVCITSLSVNDKQLLVGKNSDAPNFWMNQRNPKCTNNHMSTSQITIKNGEVFSSQCKPLFNPNDWDLVTKWGYSWTEQDFGSFFYKVYDPMDWHAARFKCESQGAQLAVPRSDGENEFISNLLPGTDIWLGIHDSDKEGIFIDNDGNPITFDLWASGEPNDLQGEDAAEIGWGGKYEDNAKDGQGRLWNDQSVGDRNNFVCTFYPPKDKYCIRVTSSEDQNLCHHYIGWAGPQHWAGGAINLKHNGEIVATIPSGFNDFEHCFRVDQIDKRNDEFQLVRTHSTDGVCITSLTVDGKQLLVGRNSDMESFWIDGDQNNCLEDFTGTTQMTIQNGLVSSSFCADQKPKAADYGLPADYIYIEKFKFFYKNTMRKMMWRDGKSLCENDGAALPVPLSDEENKFIADLNYHEDTWLGINDIENEGTFVDNDGNPITYSNWDSGEPNNVNNEDNVHIRGPADKYPTWNDERAKTSGSGYIKNVVCVYNIPEEPTPINIRASCDSGWNVYVLSGTYEPVADFNGKAIYMKQTADVNRKYWNFRFDTETSRWVFSYHHLKIVPGYTWYGSTFNELAKNTPGYGSTNVVQAAGDCTFEISGQEALTFTEWSDWSACSKTCEEGIQTRTRTCTGQCSDVESSELLESKSCNWECVLPPPELEIDARCSNSWNSHVLTGKYKAVGGLGDYAIYEKRTADGNGKWWFFYYDKNNKEFRWSYANIRIVPDVWLYGVQVTEFDKDRPGFDVTKHPLPQAKSNQCRVWIDGEEAIYE